jgi:hypothetical protein
MGMDRRTGQGRDAQGGAGIRGVEIVAEELQVVIEGDRVREIE